MRYTAKDLEELKQKRPMKKLTASDLTLSAIKEFNLRGFNCWRNNNVRAVAGRTFTGKKGVSDIIGFNRTTGRFLAIEIKSGSDKLSSLQIEFLQSVERAGGFGIVVYEEKGEYKATDISDYLRISSKALKKYEK